MSKPSVGSQTHPIDHLYVQNLHTDKDFIPVGTLLPFSGNGTIPTGYLECDGSAVSRVIFPDLFAVIGTTYGAGDGSTTFNLPDYSDGKFFEGNGTAGTTKNAGLPNIEGNATLHGTWPSNSPTYSGSLKVNDITGNRPTGSYSSGNNIIGLNFDASKSNAIYGNSNTVQPYSCTVRVIIKAFDGQTPNSALIDITQYANELNQRYDLRTDYTIIYPNGGTESNPANVTVGSTYIEANPFPNHLVTCQVEFLYNNEWGVAVYDGYYVNGYYGSGAFAKQHNDNSIVLKTGAEGLLGLNTYQYTVFPNTWTGTITAKQTTLPCRVKVWKIGKIPT